MPRIDPLQLLNCLQVLLSPTGGILSKDEVQRLASLMTKFSKKLVSKCVYVLILKNTEINLLGEFMTVGGWNLIQLWLHDAMYCLNWALVQELLELLLITPVDVGRLKSNNIPKLVKGLSKREDLPEVYDLSNQLVQRWLKIVKDETQSDLSIQRQQLQSTVASMPPAMPEAAEVSEEVNLAEPDEETPMTLKEDMEQSTPQTFYKLTLKDGKHLISKVGGSDMNYTVLENVEVVEQKEEEEVKEKDKSKEKKKSHDKDKHKSSSKSSNSSRDKDKDKSRSHKDKHKRSSSSSKDRDKEHKERSKDKDKHRNNGTIKSSKSSSSKDKEKDKKENKEKQAEKDKDTLTKIQPQNVQKLPKIPKKTDEKDKIKENNKKEESKRGTMSVEVRKNSEERPKTVKVYKSKMRSTGLEEEAKPAPPRPTKKPGAVMPPITPPLPPPPPSLPSTFSLKRTSPIHDLNAVPPEKKTKVETSLERPGAIKLIPPKPKPPVLQESDMFMDALTASATAKKEPKKRKRRASVSKDSSGSPPPSPSVSANGSLPSPIGLKNITPPKFYQDTLETEESKPAETEDRVESENIENDATEKEAQPVVPAQTPTNPIETTEEALPKPTGVLKGVLTYIKRKGPKKTIKWKPDDELVEIQYFELDETERVNVSKPFTDMAKMDVRGEREAIQMSRKLQNEDVMDVQTSWRILIEIECPAPLAEPGHKSLEKDIQFAREKSVLQDLYFKHLIPDAPSEPDPETYQIQDPIIIPIDDIENPDHDFRNRPWPEPKGSPPPPNVSNNAPNVFPNVQQVPFQNFNMGPPPPNFQNMQQFPTPHFIPQNVTPGGEWSNVNPPNMHAPPQMMPRSMPPPEMMNQPPMNPSMYMPPPENFNPMMNDNGHRFPPPPPYNQQGPGVFPLNNFNRGGFGHGHGHGHGGFRRGGGGGNGPWLRMNGPHPSGWNNNRGGHHRGTTRLCNHVRNKGFCKNRENCPFFHPNS